MAKKPTAKTDRRGLRTPNYRRHRASGQGIVTLNGRDFYLGPFGSKASRNEYDRLIAEWLNAGRNIPTEPNETTITQLTQRFREHAQVYYADSEGNPTASFERFSVCLKPLVKLYGNKPAGSFGPLALETVREQFIQAGHARTYINQLVFRIVQVFRWGVSKELVPASVYQSLKALDSLKAGRSRAREPERRKPVDDEIVLATIKHMSPQVASMVKLQRLTGMRPGEVCIIRACDIDMTGPVWIYVPERHKNTFRGKDRKVFIGPRAQSILKPWLQGKVKNQDIRLDAFLFSPAEVDQERRAKLHAGRKTYASCGNRPGSNRRNNPRKKPGQHYDRTSYTRAIAVACAKAFPPDGHLKERAARIDGESQQSWSKRMIESGVWTELQAWRRGNQWSPHRLRHTFGTEIRRQFGIEESSVLLGHSTLAATELYARKNEQLAASVALKIG